MSSVESSIEADRVIDGWLVDHREDLIALRRHLHAHPELSGNEHATTALVTARLEAVGVPCTPLPIGTGLFCDIGPTSVDVPHADTRRFAIRADLDALAMTDVKDVEYRSTVAGVAHACGHDAHTTISLGAALFWAEHPELVPGPIRLIFQPAEERVPGGALDVIDGGGLDGVGAIIGLHCEPKLDVGNIATRPAAISSAADMLTLTLHGPGGHTARPELTVDLISVAADVVTRLPQLVDQRIASLLEAAGADIADARAASGGWLVKLVFGAIHGGDAANVIPVSCVLRASVRTPSLPVWDALPDLVADAIGALLAESGATFDLDYVHGVPPVVNDARLDATVRAAATGEFGPAAIHDAHQSWGGDDFAWYTRMVPGDYIRLGVHDPGRADRLDLHVGAFDLDERALAVGVRLLVAVASEYFAPSDG
jgi:amidohydrolase